ncbi:hypothetical protein B0I35DRAFT_480348 [Stachybotrys elegans]|uniref:Uncharacterized protein n=1 Tax=Stachybotrys elegans TaxID=80388 RepID=A0A8K0STH5_9HYPO|nr:hypothetical protein B0I35DRAFT_480348 [Stachybotrys elegans]
MASSSASTGQLWSANFGTPADRLASLGFSLELPPAESDPGQLKESTMPDYKICSLCGIGGSESWACYEADRIRHVPICIERRQLRRAASLLTILWHLFEQKTFGIDGFWDDDQGNKHGGVTSRPWRGGHVFMDWPGGLVHDKSKYTPMQVKKIENACLLDQVCLEPFRIGGHFWRILLGPCCKEFECLNVVVKNTALRVGIDWLPRHDNHSVFRVTLPSGDRFAIDITAGQYGWTETLIPWDTYEAQRVERIAQVLAVDYYEDKPTTPNKIYQPMTEAMNKFRVDMLWELGTWLRGKLDRDYGGATAMLNLAEDEYNKALASLVMEGSARLDVHRHRIVNSGIGHLYFSDDEEIYATTTVEESEFWSKVWLTDAELMSCADTDARWALWEYKKARAGTRPSPTE